MATGKREDLIRSAFRTFRYWASEADKICKTSHHGENAMIPESVGEQINDALRDLLQAGADPERLKGYFYTPQSFHPTSRESKPRYRGIPCSYPRSDMQSILRAIADLEPPPPER